MINRLIIASIISCIAYVATKACYRIMRSQAAAIMDEIDERSGERIIK